MSVAALDHLILVAPSLEAGVDHVEAMLGVRASPGGRHEQVRDRALALGLDLGEPRSGGRRRPDGSMLTWRLLGADAPRLEGVIPFFIDWGTSPHPSSGVPRGGTLRSLRAQHPDPRTARDVLAGLEVEIEVEPRGGAALIATIECPRGVVSLR